MSKFNKQSKTGKLMTRPELKRQISIPLSEYHKPQIIQNPHHPSHEKQHLKDTVKKIIEQIRENKLKNKSLSSGDKTFRDVVHELMKDKSRVYNENVLKLAKSVVLQNIEVSSKDKDTTIINDTSSKNELEAEDILQTYENKISDEFNGENQMTLTITTNQPQKIRFGNAVEHNEIIKQILNH
jgi:hypothetical protein